MEEIKLTIDDKEVTTVKGKSVLEAALENGIYIPHLCYHPDLPAVGACRLCLVEIEGMEGLPGSCTTQAENGMVVRTNTTKVNEMRQWAMELIMSRHPPDCTSCPQYLNCELQSVKQFVGGSEELRVRKNIKPIHDNRENPLFIHDFTRCILCGRCVRACHELRGVGIVSFIQKGKETFIGTAFDRNLIEADCRFCGACAAVCPTGSIRDQDKLKEGKTPREMLLPCKNSCPVEIDVPRYVRLIAEGKFDESYAVIRESLPLPCVCSYICLSFCEEACRRGELNEPVGIRELKRFVSEHHTEFWKKDIKPPEPTGKKVAILGSGPAGLTAGYYLARKGHEVNIFEQAPMAGGMLRKAISRKRLPNEALEDDINEILNTGVKLELNAHDTSIDKLFDDGFDALLLAVGTTFSGPAAYWLKEEVDLDLSEHGGIEVESYDMSTSKEGVFAAGDAAYGGISEDFIRYTRSDEYYDDFFESLTDTLVEDRGDSYRSATWAIASGKKAAAHIDEYLGGDGELKETFLPPEEERDPYLGLQEGFALLERKAQEYQPRVPQYAGLNPVGPPITEEEAVQEAQRCLKCDLRLKITPPKFWGDY